MTKLGRLVVLGLGLLVIFAAPCQAQPLDIDEIRVGIYSNAPKVFVDDQGQASGFWPDLTRVIAARNGWRIQWVNGTWAEGLERLSAREIDVLVDVGVTEPRRKRFRFSSEAVHVSWSRIYARPGADVETIPDLKGLRIAGLDESFNLEGPEGLRDLLADFGIEASIVELPTYQAVFEALDEGRVDAGITNRDFGNRMQAEYDLDRTPIIFQPAELRYAFPRDDSRAARIAKSFDASLRQLKRDQDSTFYQLQERWLGLEENRREVLLPDWLGVLLIGLGLFSAFVVGGLFLLEHRVRERTRALQEEVRTRRLTESRLQSILDNAPLAVYAKDEAGQFILVNSTLESVVGRRRGEIIGTTDFDYFPPEIARAFWEMDREVFAGGVPVTRDETVLVDGVMREYISVKFPLRDDAGRIYAVCGISSDITERKRSEQLRLWQRKILELIVQPESSLDVIFDAVSRALGELSPGLRASVIQVQDGQLRVACAPQLPPEYEKEAAPSDAISDQACCAASAVARGARCVVPDLFSPEARPECRALARSADVRACWAEPIQGADGAVLGAVCSFLPEPGQPDDWQLQLVHGMAQLCGIAIERAESERESRLFGQMYASTSEAMLVLAEDLSIVRVNRAFCRIVERDEPVILGGAPDVYLDARTLEAIRRLRGSADQSLRWSGEAAVSAGADSVPVWAQIDAVRGPSGQLTHVVVMLTDIRELKRTQEEAEYLAVHDSLTGLPNRRALDNRMEEALHRSQRSGAGVAVIFLDLDRFKNINDSFGHAVGDGLLVEVAARLRDLCRQEDFVARLSGDEFAVVAEGIVRSEQLSHLLQRLLQAVARPYEVLGRYLHTTASIGVSVYPDDSESIVELLRNADTAMYRAKEAGGHLYMFYSEDMTESVYNRVVVENELRTALRLGGLALHFQPQFDRSGAVIVGCEALARWHHPEMGAISPARFIPVAEETGLINELGKWTLKEACEQAARWLSKGLSFGRVAVNVSPLQLQSGSLPADVGAALNSVGLDGRYLELEVTEGFILRGVDRAIEQLAAIRSLGVTVAIDDFGTGYSSLAYLKRLPVNRLKIDKTFVEDLPQDENDVAIVRTVIAMGQAMGLTVIAEGVENQAQLAFLAESGCLQMQGFLFGRPLPAGEFEDCLQRNGSSFIGFAP